MAKLFNTIKSSVTPVVLCGGSGTRLWPLSRSAFPKQFLNLFSETSLFQQSISRILNLQPSNIQINEAFIIANEEHRFLILEQLGSPPPLPLEIILEPLGRNTAPALTFAALMAIEKENDPILIVTPSDQIIKDEDAFNKTLLQGLYIAESGAFVVLGVKPSSPDTGFGYISQSSDEGEYGEFNVIEFKEKPDFDTAKKYLDSGNFTWNSGIFLMKASVWLSMLSEFRNDILESTTKSFTGRTRDKKFIRPDLQSYKKIPSESIDYAVIEKLPGFHPIKVLSLDAGWNDLGSWGALWNASNKDINGNVIFGDTVLHDTSNSLIYSSNRLVTASGLKDIIVIETADSVLVSDRNDSQSVRKIVNQLNLEKREEHNLHRKIFRPWGWFDILEEGDRFKVKRIQVNPGSSLSLQKHSKRSENWVVIKGMAEVLCENKNFFLKENESTYIPVGAIHKLSNPGKEALEIIEVQSGSYLGEDDIYRFEDSYGRVKEID